MLSSFLTDLEDPHEKKSAKKNSAKKKFAKKKSSKKKFAKEKSLPAAERSPEVDPAEAPDDSDDMWGIDDEFWDSPSPGMEVIESGAPPSQRSVSGRSLMACLHSPTDLLRILCRTTL
jgi:hypothetical protein